MLETAATIREIANRCLLRRREIGRFLAADDQSVVGEKVFRLVRETIFQFFRIVDALAIRLIFSRANHADNFNRRIVIEQSAALRLTAIYEWPEMAEEGGLIGYGPRLTLIYRQLARLIVKVLRGVKPEDIPVEEPAKFDLVVNLKTAKALGLTIPESFLTRADKVIE